MNSSEKTPKTSRTLLRLETHLTEHCNINCCMCSHFSPLAAPCFAEIKTFMRDMQQLSQIFEREAEYIYLLGGEPLLHPDINDFLEGARSHFPQSKIVLYTNGILLPRMPQSFWQCCHANQITFMLTRYPIRVSYLQIEQLLVDWKIDYTFCNTPGRIKTMKHLPLDLEGNQDFQQNFSQCDIGNRCIFLRDGQLFTCCLAPNIHHFNQYFNQSLQLTEHDFIDIHSENIDKEKILHFLAQPIPFCRYCAVQKRTDNHKWKISERNICEWT